MLESAVPILYMVSSVIVSRSTKKIGLLGTMEVHALVVELNTATASPPCPLGSEAMHASIC